MRGGVRLIGELLFTAGVVMLLLAAYQIYGKQFEANAEQEQLAQAMTDRWENAEDTESGEEPVDSEPLPGEAHSRMYIPGLDQQWVVVNGVSQADIEFGPGHYPSTADAGEVGNYAVAGHRVPAVFWDLDQVTSGEEIVLEDSDSFYTYEVVENTVVTPDRVEVVDPNPYDPGAEPTRSLLTLTTCHPKLDNSHRLIVHAELAEERDKSEGMPENIAHMADDAEE